MGTLWNLPLAVRGQVRTQAEPGVVAEVAEAPGIQPVFLDPPAAHTILVIKLENRGLATSDCRVAVCQYGARPTPRRHCQLSGCEMATEIRMPKVPFRRVADRAFNDFLTTGHSKEPLTNCLQELFHAGQ